MRSTCWDGTGEGKRWGAGPVGSGSGGERKQGERKPVESWSAQLQVPVVVRRARWW
jgi:hypothetical protein